MATTFKFYNDASLTDEFMLGTDYIGPITSPPQQTVIYFGSTDATKKLQAAAPGTPGTTPVYVTIEDAASGSGLEATDVKLALNDIGDLATAVAGDPLDLTHTVLGGTANKLTIYLEVDFAAGGIASDTNVSLNVLGDEYAV